MDWEAWPSLVNHQRAERTWMGAASWAMHEELFIIAHRMADERRSRRFLRWSTWEGVWMVNVATQREIFAVLIQSRWRWASSIRNLESWAIHVPPRSAFPKPINITRDSAQLDEIWRESARRGRGAPWDYGPLKSFASCRPQQTPVETCRM